MKLDSKLNKERIIEDPFEVEKERWMQKKKKLYGFGLFHFLVVMILFTLHYFNFLSTVWFIFSLLTVIILTFFTRKFIIY